MHQGLKEVKMVLSRQLKETAEAGFASRLPHLGNLGKEIEERTAELPEEEAVLMKFFYGTMPLGDAASYPFDLYLSFVRHSLMLRKRVAWCRDLPEDIFVRNVLYYRINSEKIEDCRPFFWNEVKERIHGLSMEDAVLELNRYAAEHVTYKASDERTLSPLVTYASGDGRCGEESVFFVSVLRSCGIPARQVYVPLWAHCDDNHAWCEVYLKDGWHYIGACEPEMVLDRGWFDGAASRALLVHAREFTDYRLPRKESLRNEEGMLGRDHGVYFLNRTSGYADTVLLTIRVTDHGRPVENAEVTLSILNYAQFAPVASLKTNEKGVVSLRIGRGTLLVTARMGDRYAEALVHAEEETQAELSLLSREEYLHSLPGTWKHFSVNAPKEHILYAKKPTPTQQKEREKYLEVCGRIRSEIPKKAPFDPKGDSRREHFLDTLSGKDRKDVTEEIFEDAEKAENRGFDAAFFDRYVYSERIGKEELSPWRGYLSRYFDADQRARFQSDPRTIHAFVQEHVTYYPEEDYPTIVTTPEATLRLMQGNPESQRILEAAIARTVGVPARLDPVTGRVQYFDPDTDAFVSMEGTSGNPEREETAEVILHPGTETFHYEKNWTIAKFTAGESAPFQTLHLGQDSIENADGSIRLSAGWYRLTTAVRDPSGNLHGEEMVFQALPGSRTEITMKADPIHVEDLMVHCTFEDFDVTTVAGETSTFFAEQQKNALAVFLDPGMEPSEHVLNEILEQKEQIPRDLELIFLLDGEKACSKPAVSKVLAEVPVKVLYQKGLEQASMIARHLYVDNEKLPLLMLLTPDHVSVYGCSGYNVGSIALALKICSMMHTTKQKT